MEAVALYDFNSTKPDELSFKKSSELLIVSMQEYPHWFKARQHGNEGMIPTNYIKMKPHPWYIRNCTRKEAEDRLLERLPNKEFLQPDGAFILRDSENHPGLYSISVKLDKSVLHFRVFLSTESKYYVWSTTFKSLNELIDHHRTTTIYGNKNTILRDFLPSNLYGNDNMSDNRGKEPSNGIKQQQANSAPFNSNRYGQGQPAAIGSPGNIMNSASHPNPITSPPSSASMVKNVPIPEGYTRKMAGQLVRTDYEFNAEFSEELGFKPGEEILVLGEEDENWWYGEIASEKGVRRGLFPSNYVTVKGPATNLNSRTNYLASNVQNGLS